MINNRNINTYENKQTLNCHGELGGFHKMDLTQYSFGISTICFVS